MNKNFGYLAAGIIILVIVIVFVIQPSNKQSVSTKKSDIITVSGAVSTSLPGSKPFSLNFTNHGGSNSKTSTIHVKDGYYSIRLDNHNFYDISVKYSSMLVGNTTVVPPPSNCGTLPLISGSPTFHYDVIC